ncbi:MAG: YdcF family protein [Pseudomonadota bacterium]|nr:YdcF family protein [Pseudomonadota bacterium]MDE3038294.1 YdcF family protein [Pseudomonadota bacterium]
MFRRILLSFFFCVCAWLAGLIWFIGQIPAAPLKNIASADAIVVLTGGSGRLAYGLELLAQDKGKMLFISGVSDGVTVPTLLRQAGVDAKAPLRPVNAESIALGHKARNTIGNAEETLRWLKQRGYHSILLVTSDYHMPRSLLEFKATAPDITVTPAPVFPGDVNPSGWWADKDSRTLILLEYHKFLAASLRHWLLPALHRS